MDDFENERNKSLIEEREEYERQYYESIIDSMIESDALDRLITDRLKYIDENFDFNPTDEYLRLEEKYSFPYNDVDSYDEIREDIDYSRAYETIIEDALIEQYDREEKHLEELIKQHLEEEKSFMDNLLMQIIEEDYLFERTIDELIFNEIDIDYNPDYFDYQDNGYWYDDHFDQPDESVIDPFDSFGEIDYPEGNENREIELMNEFMKAQIEENEIRDAVEEDFLRYQKQKSRKHKVPEPPEEEEYQFEDIDDKRNRELIENQQRIESIFRDYFTKDDTLDNIIRVKLKEKKFNQ